MFVTAPIPLFLPEALRSACAWVSALCLVSEWFVCKARRLALEVLKRSGRLAASVVVTACVPRPGVSFIFCLGLIGIAKLVKYPLHAPMTLLSNAIAIPFEVRP